MRVYFLAGTLGIVMGPLRRDVLCAYKRYNQMGAHGQKNCPWAAVKVQMGGGSRI